MSKHLPLLYLLGCLCLLTRFAIGQSILEKTKFLRIEVSAGLSNSNVTCIIQDSKGFLWVGTEDGLNKYDGYGFKVYRHLAEDTLSLLKNSINSLFEDSHGILWVNTRGGGVHYYDNRNDRFIRISEFSQGCDIVRFLEDSNNNLWISGTRQRQAFAAKLDRVTKRWQHFNLFESHEPICAIIQASENEFWIGVRRTGFFKWNWHTNKIENFFPDKNNSHSIISIDITNAVKDDRGNVWIATRQGLSKLETKTKKFTNYISNPTDKNSLPVNTVRDICTDNHLLWIATENGGLSRLNTIENQFTHFQFDKNDPTTISDNSVWSVYKDHQDRIWVGTFSKGLCIIDDMREKFSELNVPLENDIVNAIWQDQKNRLWIGTEGGLVLKDKGAVKYYKHKEDDPGTLSSNPVLSIFEDSKNQLWFGTWEGGVNKYDEKQDRFIHFLPDKDNPKSLSNPNVYSIAEYSPTHQLLVATYKGLNVLMDEKLGVFKRFIDPFQESNNYLRRIYEDREGDLWIGSISELDRLDIDTDKRERFYYTNDTTSFDAISNCIMEDHSGKLWVGSNYGLHLMGTDNFIEWYTTKDGLPNNIVNGILEDDDGDLWLSTTQGISQFNPKSKTFKNYNVSDGLLSNEFKPNACFKSKDGLFFFGGKGVNVFHPDKIKVNPFVPPVYLTDLKIFNHSVKIGDYDSLLLEHIRETKEISLPQKLNFFSIEFVALNFSNSSKNQYAYKLEGFDDDWVFLNNQRSATFTNLDAGTYTFRVKASNNDGIWNEAGASLMIHILPPWWKTTWFKLLLALFVASLVIGFYRIRIRQIKLMNLKLEKLVEERTKELKHVNEELIAREEEIYAQNEDLVAKREELAVQNKELIEQREELATQNEALEKSKKQQLDLYTQKIVEKSEIISRINAELELIKGKALPEQDSVEKFNQILQSHILTDEDWERFKHTFNEVYPNFFASLRYRFSEITTAELRLSALIKMNLNLKEASAMLGISPESVKKSRHRLKKRFGMQEEDSLEEFIKKIS